MKKGVLFAGVIALALFVVSFPAAQAEEIPNIKTVTSQVSALVSSSPLTQYAADGADMCFLIRTGERSFLSFDILKEDGTVHIDPSPASIYCDNTPANEGPEDLVIQYVSYDAFLRHVSEPSCEMLKTGGAGREFYYLPSQFVQAGGMPVCDSTFEERYCPAVRACASNAEMRAGGLRCCIEPGAILGNTAVVVIILFALIASFLITLLIILRKGKAKGAQKAMALRAEKISELREFIENEIKQGYSTRDIREHLLRTGWSKDAIDSAMEPYEKPFW